MTSLVKYANGQTVAGAASSVASVAADATLLAANQNRVGATIFNDSSAVLYVLLAAGAASANNFTNKLAAGAYYELPADYTGIVKGFWASANGFARVTEFS